MAHLFALIAIAGAFGLLVLFLAVLFLGLIMVARQLFDEVMK